jgi:hypothetical protein
MVVSFILDENSRYKNAYGFAEAQKLYWAFFEFKFLS